MPELTVRTERKTQLLDVTERVDRELWSVHEALDHGRLGHVADEEVHRRRVVGPVDRPRT